MIIEAWNGVRWKPCRESELPLSIDAAIEAGLAFCIAPDRWRVWPTFEAKTDWRRFMSQTYMTEFLGDPSCGEY
jgi:hypothetical protein